MRCYNTAFHKKSLVKRAEGFTLVELLVASALFLTFTTLLMQAFNMGFASVSDMETLNLAYFLVENKLEAVRNKPFNQIDNESRQAVTGFTDYETEVQVTLPKSPNQKIKKVVVNLYFPKKGGGTRNVWLKTLVTDIG